MITRAYRSISCRISTKYRESLRDWFKGRVLRRGYASLSPKPIWNMTLLLYAGAQQKEMVRECLWSIYHAWPELPRVKLVSDGSVTPSALLESIDWWPGEKKAESWEAGAEYHAQRGRVDVRTFAGNNMLGKKLSAILAAGESERVLYCDSDLLWFGGPPAVPDASVSAAVQLAVDLSPHYDDHLLKMLSINDLDKIPALNTGLVYASGPVYTECGLDRLMSIVAREPSYFSEQTIMAYAARKLGGRHWPLDQIILKVDDKSWPIRHPSERPSWMARHYVGDVRHWFWRDALWLRGQERPVPKAAIE